MKSVDIVKELKVASTSEAIRQIIARLQKHRATSAAEVVKQGEARPAALLDGNEQELAKIRAAQAAAADEVEDSDTLLGELQKRLAAAEAAERQKEFDGLRDRALAHQRHGADALREYEKLAKKIQPLVLAAQAHKMHLQRINAIMVAAGQAHVADPEQLLCARADQQVTPMLHKLTLPSASDSFNLIYPISQGQERVDAQAAAEAKALADVQAEIGK